MKDIRVKLSSVVNFALAFTDPYIVQAGKRSMDLEENACIIDGNKSPLANLTKDNLMSQTEFI